MDTKTKTMTYEDVKTEMMRRKSRRESLLLTFKREGELTTRDLEHFGSGVSSRIKELRRAGHRIVARYEKPGLYTYIYLGNKEDDDQTDGSVNEID